jgi:hypothetical protein
MRNRHKQIASLKPDKNKASSSYHHDVIVEYLAERGSGQVGLIEPVRAQLLLVAAGRRVRGTQVAIGDQTSQRHGPLCQRVGLRLDDATTAGLQKGTKQNRKIGNRNVKMKEIFDKKIAMKAKSFR